jgi:hypothetical protein
MTGERVERTQTSLVKVCESTEATSKITQSIQSTLEKIATVVIRQASSPIAFNSVLMSNKRCNSAAKNAG